LDFKKTFPVEKKINILENLHDFFINSFGPIHKEDFAMYILLDKITCTDTSLCFYFDYSDDLKPYLWGEKTLTITSTYPLKRDESALAGVFCLALAPLGWILGAQFESGYAIDNEVLSCINRIGSILSKNYSWKPTAPFIWMRSTTNNHTAKAVQALFFSGGVDSLASLYRLKNRITCILHLTNFDYENVLLQQSQKELSLINARMYASQMKLDLIHCETNLSSVINHCALDKWFPRDCSFWLGLQHVNHMAVVMNAIDASFSPLYVSGSLDPLHKKIGSCASSSSFINSYMMDSRLEVFDENVSRQKKVEFLIDTAPRVFKNLRVCYTSGDAVCSDCAKCQGTALMIIAGGGHLADTNFPHSIREKLMVTLAKASLVPPDRNMLIMQSLTGRMLKGTQKERYITLFDLLANGKG